MDMTCISLSFSFFPFPFGDTDSVQHTTHFTSSSDTARWRIHRATFVDASMLVYPPLHIWAWERRRGVPRREKSKWGGL
jgi:hypothetical protein